MMIQGYPDTPSVFPGDTIQFRVSTDAPQFRIDFYRQGASLDSQLSTGWLPGAFADDHDPDQDWGVAAVRRDGKAVAAWQAYPFDVPEDPAHCLYFTPPTSASASRRRSW
jgi:hypothetical protein